MTIQKVAPPKLQFDKLEECKPQVEAFITSVKETLKTRSATIVEVSKACFDCMDAVDKVSLDLLDQVVKEEQLLNCSQFIEEQKKKLAPLIESFVKSERWGFETAQHANLFKKPPLRENFSKQELPSHSDQMTMMCDALSSGMMALFSLQAEFDSQCTAEKNEQLLSCSSFGRIMQQLFDLQNVLHTFNQYPGRYNQVVRYLASAYGNLKIDYDGRIWNNLYQWSNEQNEFNHRLNYIYQDMCTHMVEAVGNFSQESLRIKDAQRSFTTRVLQSMTTKIQQNQQECQQITRLFIEVLVVSNNARLHSFDAFKKVRTKIMRENINDMLILIENMIQLRIAQLKFLESDLISSTQQDILSKLSALVGHPLDERTKQGHANNVIQMVGPANQFGAALSEGFFMHVKQFLGNIRTQLDQEI